MRVVAVVAAVVLAVAGGVALAQQTQSPSGQPMPGMGAGGMMGPGGQPGAPGGMGGQMGPGMMGGGMMGQQGGMMGMMGRGMMEHGMGPMHGMMQLLGEAATSPEVRGQLLVIHGEAMKRMGELMIEQGKKLQQKK